MASLPMFCTSPDGNTVAGNLSARRKRSVSGTTGETTGAGNRFEASGHHEDTKKHTVDAEPPVPTFPATRIRLPVAKVELAHVRNRRKDGGDGDDGDDEDGEDGDDGEDGEDGDDDESKGRTRRTSRSVSTLSPSTSISTSQSNTATSRSPLTSLSTASISSTSQASVITSTVSSTQSSTLSSPDSQSSQNSREISTDITSSYTATSITSIVTSDSSGPTATMAATPSGIDSPSPPNVGLICGIIAGIVVLIVILISMLCFLRRRRIRRAQGTLFNYPFIGYGKNRNSTPSSIGFNPLAMVRQRSRRSIKTILSSFKRVRRKPVPVYSEEDLTSVSSFSTDTYSSRVLSDDLTSSSPSFQEKMPIGEDYTHAMHPAGQDEKGTRIFRTWTDARPPWFWPPDSFAASSMNHMRLTRRVFMDFDYIRY
ncbi:hypothetical protein VNI00_009972 [Paramarasmius palmivorus]|uniref:Mid2 domain-containing protein n=1 Tax=Paramarasmius palmivorus TaxID=297713 RepID=A0AAW0CKM9_9AGAR